jgi:hypothetical protein
MQLVTTTGRRDVTGVFGPLPGLPEKFLYNAENVMITGNGRIFATGSKGVYEIVAESDTEFRAQEVPVVAPGVPRACFKNGLAVHGEALYLACYRLSVPFSKHCDATNLEQTLFNLCFVFGAVLTIGQAASWVVRAKLQSGALAFEETVASIPSRCTANGLAIDERGENLYVANTVPWLLGGGGIHRIGLTLANGNAGKAWYRPLPYPFLLPPNGLKIRGDRVYYTCTRALPIPAASLEYVSVGDPRRSEVVYTQAPLGGATGFDDFDVVDDGFVIANFLDWTFGKNASGALRFVTKDGKLKGTFRHRDLQHPSAVKVVTANGPGLRAGDVLVTDKTRHCVSLLQPDDEWREWLIGSFAHSGLERANGVPLKARIQTG